MEIQPQSGSGQHPNIHIPTVSFCEADSLRHKIRTIFPNGMPEDSIAFVLRDILKGLSYLHESLNTGHTCIDTGQIYVGTDHRNLPAVKIVLRPGQSFVHPPTFPERKQGKTPTQGIWGAGIITLESAYGSLPRNCTRQQHLVSMAKNMIRVLKLKLDINGDDDDDHKRKEKTEDKGKQIKLGNADDQRGKEKATKKGETMKKLMIKMPELEKLMDDGYVEELEKKLIKEKKDREKKKKPMVVLQEKYKKAVMFFSKKDGDDDGIEREFSRDFLEVVAMCLDDQEQNPIPAKRILDHPFFQQPIDVQKFERSMRLNPNVFS